MTFFTRVKIYKIQILYINISGKIFVDMHKKPCQTFLILPKKTQESEKRILASLKYFLPKRKFKRILRKPRTTGTG